MTGEVGVVEFEFIQKQRAKCLVRPIYDLRLMIDDLEKSMRGVLRRTPIVNRKS
jgi:hypothetical protein